MKSEAKNTLTLEQFRGMWAKALERINEQEQALTALDAKIGDGDHGTAILQALSSVVEAGGSAEEFKSMLTDMGMNVMMQTSGSTSSLMGAFLLGMSDHAGGTCLDAAQVREMFSGGLQGLNKQTKATVGDKTMMDAVIPAIEAMQKHEATDIKALFSAAADAAREGADATVHMQARFGRARNYGERSVGTADAGATSWACMFEAFRDTL